MLVLRIEVREPEDKDDKLTVVVGSEKHNYVANLVPGNQDTEGVLLWQLAGRETVEFPEEWMDAQPCGECVGCRQNQACFDPKKG